MSLYVKDEGGDWGGVLIWSKINIAQILSEYAMVFFLFSSSNIGFQYQYAFDTLHCEVRIPCSVAITCFHTTASQHWVFWEYYLYGQNRCTQMSGSHWLCELGRCISNMLMQMNQTAQVSKCICLNLNKCIYIFTFPNFKLHWSSST